MLPDFPKSKQDFEKLLLIRLRDEIKQRNLFARYAPSIVQHEGDRMAHDQMLREGKRVVESTYERAEAGIMIKIEEVPDLVGDVLLQKLSQIAEDIAGQTSRSAFKKMDEVITEAGGGVDAAGGPLTPDLYLESLEKMEMTFDSETLQPTFMIVIHPDTTPAMLKLKDMVENDPHYKRKYDELIARKLKDWRDRESDRRLVD